jgi:hypothetical protein
MNDLADFGRNRCITLDRTDYFPTSARDVQATAGYFRHISKDPDQRSKFIDYLNSNPADKEKFLRYWSDKDNLVRYFLKANREEGIIASIDRFISELGAEALKSQAVFVESFPEKMMRIDKNARSFSVLFGKFENLTPANVSLLEKYLQTKPEAAVEFLMAWSADAPWKKALLKDNPKAHANVEKVFTAIADRIHKQDVNQSNKKEVLEFMKKQADSDATRAKEAKIAEEIIRDYRKVLMEKSAAIFHALEIDSPINDQSQNLARLQKEVRELSMNARLTEAAKKAPDGSATRKNIEAIYHAMSVLTTNLHVRKLFSGSAENYASENQSKKDIVNTALTTGEIKVNTYLGSHGNEAVDLAKIEKDLKNKSIKELNSTGFASYIKSLRATGKLSYRQLSQESSLGSAKLAEIALHWNVESSLKTKDDKQTTAQKSLQQSDKAAYDMFNVILAQALKNRSEKLNFEKGGGYPQIAEYLASPKHQLRFSQQEIKEIT